MVLPIGNSPHIARPCCIANSAAAARVETPILASAFWTWRSAVLVEIPSARAICLVCMPRYPAAVATLLDSLREAGADEQVTVLATRAADHTNLDDPGHVAILLDSLREAGAGEQVTALATRTVGHTNLDDPGDVAILLDSLQRAGAREQVTALATRTADVAAIGQIGLGIS